MKEMIPSLQEVGSEIARLSRELEVLRSLRRSLRRKAKYEQVAAMQLQQPARSSNGGDSNE